jgi:7-carboxy-7-deazaguanine synthase
MFGKNPPRPREHEGPVGQLAVQGEPFFTIQGEGPHAGTPALFIRLWGCHLHCWFCDTDFESSRQVTEVEKLVGIAEGSPAPLVVLTGGEPMRQNITELCLGLLGIGKMVQIETAGSFWIEGTGDHGWLRVVPHPRFSIVVSPKTPKIHPLMSLYADAYKYIISADMTLDEDGLPICNTQIVGGKARPLAKPTESHTEVYLQAMDEYDAAKNTANAARVREIAMRHGYRVSTQLHKLWGMP